MQYETRFKIGDIVWVVGKALKNRGMYPSDCWCKGTGLVEVTDPRIYRDGSMVKKFSPYKIRCPVEHPPRIVVESCVIKGVTISDSEAHGYRVIYDMRPLPLGMSIGSGGPFVIGPFGSWTEADKCRAQSPKMEDLRWIIYPLEK